MVRFIKRNLVVSILVVILIVPIAFVVGVAIIGGSLDSNNYTYRITTAQWPKDWNPTTWELGSESTILQYIGSTFYEIYEELDDNGNPIYVDGEGDVTTEGNGIVKGGYQLQDATAWPEDISLEIATRSIASSASNYGVSLMYNDDGGLELDADGNPQLGESQERKAWRIPVRGDLRWEDGTFITMDDYEFTYKTMLSPEFKAYRSNLMREGNSSIYGANAYWQQRAVPNWQTLGVSWDSVGIEFETARREGDSAETMGSIIFVYNSQGEPTMQDLVVRWSSFVLLHKETFEANTTRRGELLIANYNTSLDNTMAWGPYKLVALSDNSYTVERNRYWGMTADMQPRFEGQYQVTHIKVDLVTNDSTRRLEFLNGNLDQVPLSSTDTDLRGSSQRRDEHTSYSMRMYFNFDRDSLNKIQAPGSTAVTSVHNPENLQFLANDNFRKAFSLSMNRTELGVAYGPASTASVVLWNSLYFLSLDPVEQYRYGDDALRALLQREGIDTTGMSNADMRSSYNGITGFDRDQATQLFAQARREELVTMGKPADSNEQVTVRFTVYTGNTASVIQQQPMLTQMQTNINAATPDNLRVEFTLRAQPGGINRYAEVDLGGIEASVGALGGATSNITSPLRTFLGLSSAKTSGGYDNGGTMGFRPQDTYATIDMTPVLESGDDVAANMAQALIDYNKDDEHNANNPSSNHLTLALNQWGTLFGRTEKPDTAETLETGVTILADNIDYSFLPATVGEQGKNHPYIGRAVNIYWMRHIQPYLETAILDEYGQIPLVMDVSANMVSFRVKTLLRSPDARFVVGSLRFLKITVSDGDWAKEVANNRAALRELYFL